MAYQVLARKLRPQDFHSLVGQEHVLRALVHALDEQRLHHAYLFSGTRGVGKTTIARILARCLNCEQGISSTPCGTCSSCVEISEGRFVDLIEVDAASRTKVEDTRELLENVQYAPTRGRFKVYLIDEVHMLSTSSFNALLKTLEEPPPHVKFLLATTDPHKLPVTVLSRCLQFNLKNMPAEQIATYLQKVLGEEQINFDEPSVWQIGRAAKGSMRDALSLTDQAIAFCGGELSETAVNQMLGSIDQSRVVALVQALQQGDGSAILQQVAELAEQGQNFVVALEDLLSMLHQIAVCQVVPNAPVAVQFDNQVMQDLAQLMPAADIQLFYQMGSVSHKDLALAPDIRNGFEMALLRMLAFRPQIDPQQLRQVSIPQVAVVQASSQESTQASQAAPVAEAIEEAEPDVAVANEQTEPISEASIVETPTEPQVEAEPESEIEATAEQEPPVAVPQVPVMEQAAETSVPTDKTSNDQIVGHVNVGEENLPLMADVPPWEETPAGWQGQTSSTVSEQLVEGQAELDPQPVPEQVLATELTEELSQPKPQWTLADLDQSNWANIFRDLEIDGLTRSIAANMVFAKRVGTQLTFTLEQGQTSMLNAAHQGRIRQSLEAMFACDLQLAIDIGNTETETPFARRERRLGQHQQEAVESLQADPYVDKLAQVFNGQLDLGTVEPVQSFEE